MEAARDAHENLSLVEMTRALQMALAEGIHLKRVRELAHEALYPTVWLGEEAVVPSLVGLMLDVERRVGHLSSTRPEVDFAELCSPDRARRLAALKRLGPEQYASLTRRYFPGTVLIEGGEFEMGSAQGHENERPVRLVRVRSYRLGLRPVTAWQIALYCRDTGRVLPNDGGFGRGEHPVINISWYEAVDYCNWLSSSLQLDEAYIVSGSSVESVDSANGFRLPTEAEWEFAARERGGHCVFGNGASVARTSEINFDASAESQYFWSGRNRPLPDGYEPGEWRRRTSPVASFPPNALGLYDMSGNVWEWCWDWYDAHYYRVGPYDDPQGSNAGEYRSLRGGSWSEPADGCRCTFRDKDDPIYHIQVVGVRIARSQVTEDASAQKELY